MNVKLPKSSEIDFIKFYNVVRNQICTKYSEEYNRLYHEYKSAEKKYSCTSVACFIIGVFLFPIFLCSIIGVFSSSSKLNILIAVLWAIIFACVVAVTIYLNNKKEKNEENLHHIIDEVNDKYSLGCGIRLHYNIDSNDIYDFFNGPEYIVNDLAYEKLPIRYTIFGASFSELERLKKLIANFQDNTSLKLEFHEECGVWCPEEFGKVRGVELRAYINDKHYDDFIFRYRNAIEFSKLSDKKIVDLAYLDEYLDKAKQYAKENGDKKVTIKKITEPKTAAKKTVRKTVSVS